MPRPKKTAEPPPFLNLAARSPTSHHDCGPSSLGRRALCAASLRLEAEAKAIGMAVEPGEAAEEGTLLHSLLPPHMPLERVEKLTSEQVEAVEKARQYIAERTKGGDLPTFYEFCGHLHRDSLGYTTGELNAPPSGKFVNTSHPELLFGWLDVFKCIGKAGVVIDLKFGRAELHQELVSWQLLALSAIALEQNPLIDTVRAYVFQVRTGVEYTGEFRRADLTGLLEKIAAVVEAANDPKAQPVPSPAACCYCSARSICPAFEANGRELMLTEPARALAPQLARCLDFAQAIGPWIDQVKKVAREALAAGQEIPGWELGERKTRVFKGGIFEALDAVDGVLDQAQVLGCAEVRLTALEDAYVAAKKGNGTVKDAKAELKQRLEGMGALIVTAQKVLKRKDSPNGNE